MIGLSSYLVLAALVFSIGLFGVLTRRNAVGILLGIELMLNAVNINLVAFARYNGDLIGVIFTLVHDLHHRGRGRRGARDRHRDLPGAADGRGGPPRPAAGIVP